MIQEGSPSEGQGECESESEEENEVQIASGLTLMVMRCLNAGKEEVASELEQRNNIFLTRCSIQGEVFLVMIDGGSMINCASDFLVSKFNLPLMKRPISYMLGGLAQRSEIEVTHYVLVSFSIGRFCCKVYCDVVPMAV
jgi:hypothetical protein